MKPRIRLKPKVRRNVVEANFNRVNHSLVGVLENRLQEAKDGIIHTACIASVNKHGRFTSSWAIRDGSYGTAIGATAYLQSELSVNYAKIDKESELCVWIEGEQ